MKRLALALSIAATLALSATAGAQNYNFPMDGLQEVPPTPSPGTGTCTVLVDDPANTVDVSCSYSGLTSNAIASHIHAPAPPGVNAGVVLGLSNTGGTAGTISSGGPQPLSETNIQHILAGNAYVNLHTNNFPGGEIRGQIVPEPGALALLALGSVVLLRRSRRRA